MVSNLTMKSCGVVDRTSLNKTRSPNDDEGKKRSRRGSLCCALTEVGLPAMGKRDGEARDCFIGSGRVCARRLGRRGFHDESAVRLARGTCKIQQPGEDWQAAANSVSRRGFCFDLVEVAGTAVVWDPHGRGVRDSVEVLHAATRDPRSAVMVLSLVQGRET